MKNTIKTNMLKTVSISLSILSAQILFAQADNRLKATNQVTGCRLKDRLKAGGYRLEEKKNQNKNYKLQIADNRKTESSEYQTNQGGEIATNYELRTTNYNNQGEDLDCYLMMDPEEISLAEDILGFSSGKTIPSTITTLTIFKGGTSAGQKNSVSTAIEGERGVKECSAKRQESTSNPQRQQRIDNSLRGQALSVYCEKWLAETGSVDGVSYVSNCITHVADHRLVRAFEKYRSNVIKAHNVGDDALALSWIQVAEDIQQAIEASIKHAEAYQNLELYCHPQSVYDGRLAKEAHFMTLYGINTAWENVCYAMEEIAEYREKYIKTSMISQIPENILPDMKEKKKIIEQLEFIANYLKKAAEAYSVGKEQEYNCFKSVAQSMQESIYGLKAAARAKEENQRELEALWFKAVDCYEEIAKYYDQAVNIWSSENTTECSHIDQIKEFTKEAYLNNIPNFLQPKLKDENRLLPICNNNADRLQQAARALEKSLDNSDADDAEISAFWRRVSEQYQLVVELNIQATQEEIQGNKEEATRLKEAANIAENAVTSAEERIDYWLGKPPMSCYSSLLCKHSDPLS
ncbi:MAG TPA: hypothetical protein VJK54_04525 [Chthoniobacterales bacterium]|nr:hypothetical protein [Chthoniobacterales bacterium]